MQLLQLIKLLLSLVLALSLLACGSNGDDTKIITDKPIDNYAIDIQILNAEQLGTVTILPENIVCTSSCTTSVAANTAITLTHKSNDNSSFQGWGGACAGLADCKVTVNQDITIQANFIQTINQKTLTIKNSHNGQLYLNGTLINCPNQCSYAFEQGEQVSLSTSSNEAFNFDGWSGACSGTGNCTLLMNQDASVEALFSELIPQHVLAITTSNNGQIYLDDNPISCTETCFYSFEQGSQIMLSANADKGFSFDGWPSQCTNTSTGGCILQMDQNIEIELSFSKEIIFNSLTITTNNLGQLQLNNQTIDCITTCSFTYEQGSVVTLTAIANEGYIFDGWSGACKGQAECSITLNEDTSVQASFSAIPIVVYDKNSSAMVITEPYGETHSNYPIQIGRPFVEGEISNFPQVLINGEVITSQANVMQRHPDGSVKHAILSFIIPEVLPNSSRVITFENTESSNETPLSKAEMLNTQFDAQMALTFTDEATISAKDMLTSDHYNYWLKGPIATSIILADHSEERVYDVGSDSYRSIRPLFHITFWPTINKYHVRYIGESANTESLQDQTYQLALKIDGNTFYNSTVIPHQTMTRWTLSQWSGEQFKPLSINHNVHYLVKTRSLPNFDVERVIPESTISKDWQLWQSKDTDLYDKGWWQSAMATGGGRPDIGIYPAWTVKWLFTGDWRYQTIATKQADLASAWPIFLREGDSSRRFDFAGSYDGIGRILSMAPQARPTHWTARPDWHEVADIDKINYVGNHEKTLWRPDKAHHPDLASPQYLLTGDYYYLEQMLFSAAYVSGDNNAKGYKSTLGRGPTGSEGGLYSGEVRGQGWALRTRLHAYDILPDNFPEKAYFHQLNQNAISMWEGLMAISLTNVADQELYDFVKNNVIQNEFKRTLTPSAIGLWDEGISSASYVRSDRVNTDKVGRAMAPWMQNFVIIALGRAKELGYNTQNLLNFSGQLLTSLFSDETLSPAMMSAYIIPTLDKNNQWFTSWSTIYQQYTDAYTTEVQQYVLNNQDTEHGYHSIAMAAAAYLNGLTHHDRLWQYIQQNIASKTIYDSNPKWAIVPRTE